MLCNVMQCYAISGTTVIHVNGMIYDIIIICWYMMIGLYNYISILWYLYILCIDVLIAVMDILIVVIDILIVFIDVLISMDILILAIDVLILAIDVLILAIYMIIVFVKDISVLLLISLTDDSQLTKKNQINLNILYLMILS